MIGWSVVPSLKFINYEQFPATKYWWDSSNFYTINESEGSYYSTESVYFCYEHGLPFNNLSEQTQHAGQCAQTLRYPIVCHQYVQGIYCCARIQTVSSLVIHTIAVHKNYLCNECGNLYSSIQELEGHEHFPTSHLGVYERD